MATYHLYRSGILEGKFEYTPDKTLVHLYGSVGEVERSAHELNEEDSLQIEAYYCINPMEVFKNLEEYERAFQTTSKEITLSSGDVYEKHEKDHRLWVQRKQKFPLDIVVVEGKPVGFIAPTRENCHVLVKEGYEQHTPVSLWENEQISSTQYRIIHEGTFMVPMRDGVKLATDLWRPDSNKKSFPVVFVRTPYGRMSYQHSYVHFIKRGYAVVIQDTRGRQDSEGDWFPMYNEVEDGDDSLNWIADQSWCDGNIGMIGASYGGFVQWAAAASGNPHLKAMVSIVTAGSPFIDIPRKGGAFVSGMLPWSFAMMEKTFKPEKMIRNDWDKILQIRPIKEIPKKVLGWDVPFWNQWMLEHKNSDFWKHSTWATKKEHIKAPAFIVSGWFDDNGMGTTEALEVVEDYPANDKKVILGPWMHQANTTRDIQGMPLGSNSLRYDLDVRFQQWFDAKLKGMSNGIEKTPTVEYYDTGTNKWNQAENWPLAKAENKSLYLSTKQMSADKHSGWLSWQGEVIPGKDTFIYDPSNPAPHLIDISENEIGLPANYREVEKRDDVLTYTTEPLKKPVKVVGDLLVKFYASSSAKDTDWIVRVTDVDPDGTSTKLVDGVLRARFRNGFEKEKLLETGRIEAYEIRTSKLAHTFKKGHCIRLMITSSAKNFIFPNTNTGENPATDVNTEIATQTIYYSSEYPSCVELPVIEEKD